MREKFGEFFRTLTPPFEAFSANSPYCSPADLVFTAKGGHNLRLFLAVMPNSDGKQCFTLWFGWSQLGRFPELDERRVMEHVPDETRFTSIEFRERIGAFLGKDKWWFLEDPGNWKSHFRRDEISRDEAAHRVSRALEDVKVDVVTLVLPYFQALLSSGRSRWQS